MQKTAETTENQDAWNIQIQGQFQPKRTRKNTWYYLKKTEKKKMEEKQRLEISEDSANKNTKGSDAGYDWADWIPVAFWMFRKNSYGILC